MEETLSFHVQKPGLMGCLFLIGEYTARERLSHDHQLATDSSPEQHHEVTTQLPQWPRLQSDARFLPDRLVDRGIPTEELSGWHMSAETRDIEEGRCG